jgi:hypothetical protein
MLSACLPFRDLLGVFVVCIIYEAQSTEVCLKLCGYCFSLSLCQLGLVGQGVGIAQSKNEKYLMALFFFSKISREC